ncbi:MAG: sigma-54-dependent Fis family transcriptional regulator [Acetobacteraceae bacterium]|nr:sigma-54-dependent Fis family transcriptional regulator [Acetobacteraceae bacterium]
MSLSDEERLSRARTVLERRGAAPEALLPDEISASWRRCLAAGLDPARPPPMRVLDPSSLREQRERHEFVARLALAEMRSLNHQIAGTNHLIAFAAPDGMLLETLADPTFLPTARSSGIRPGGLWDEGARGTNALGTVATIGKPLTVHGGEHFFRQFAGLTCTAAPVFGPDAALAGILDASSDCRSRQTHTQALVKMAVAHIENGLFREHHRASLVLAFHSRAEYLHTPSAGLIAVGPDGVLLGANAQARFLLQGLPALPRRRFDEVFQTRFETLVDRARTQERLLLRDAVGSAFVATMQNLRLLSPMVARSAPVRSSAPPPRPAALPPRFVAEDPAVAASVRELTAAAARGMPILLRGATGTGKEHLARHAHAAAGRTGAFVPVNCAALPRSLVESELFGHEHGAFTGARRQGARGLVAQADGGTLLLDEIGDMPLELQAVLLRLLDDWQVRPVGGERARRVDVLLVAATNADLEGRIAAGSFRADLFYRLNVVELRLPGLAERSDFRAIATRLLTELAPAARLAPEALARLERHRWPGNIRELRNVLSRLSLACPEGTIEPVAVARLLGPEEDRTRLEPPGSALRQSVRARISAAYEQEGRNVSRAARRLGVSRNTVYRAISATRNESPSVPDSHSR